MTSSKPPKATFNKPNDSANRFGKRGMLLLLLVFIVVGLAIGGIYLSLPRPVTAIPPTTPPATKPTPSANVAAKEFVGAAVCKQCHLPEFEAWQGSHHQLAMQEANTQTVLGDFNDVKFTHQKVETTFFKRDGKYMVRTDGPDGKLTDYAISYTFGVTPLQQYLIAFPGGRYQALSIAWDSRPKTEGGQRWFHLYPKEKMDHTDQLHWTGRYQNWNMECAECHSTKLTKGYDAATDSYTTTFSEINVACETCHGPASQHVSWAKQAQQPYAEDKGLAVNLASHWQEAWHFPTTDALYAQRSELANDTLMNTCWACHARRSTLVEGNLPGLPLEDSHHPALLTQPTYYADGQQRDEDYTWGSFRQSKMFQNGVTCMDCHEPHALKLRAEGNALCTRCHQADKFDTISHHHHKPGSKGAVCMDCHAPEQNYMVVDGRHDHSFRLPRPDLSLTLGSPNACTQCHQQQKPEWAATTLDKWYGKDWRGRPHYGMVLDKVTTQGIKALPELTELAKNPSIPAIVRATATTLAAPMMSPDLLGFARQQLQDADPSVRIAALSLIESVDPVNRILSASPALEDPVRGVRIEAARILADVPDSQIPDSRINARKNAMADYLAYLTLNADWPAENVNLGNLYLRQGNSAEAITAYQRAISMDPRFIGAYINLADAYRQQGLDGEGENQLQKGLALSPKAADLHHALGLLLVRKADQTTALQELALAAKLAPENARYAYVYAIALNSTGKPREALAVLKAANSRQPYELNLLSALISIQRETGDNKAALAYAKKALVALPENKDIQQLVTELESEK
ncbi:MAG: tetratricopeptide repeat protein [Methylococcales bacterium]|nr:tetratricopeptide repeat protein [Methylococcales bacterium]